MNRLNFTKQKKIYSVVEITNKINLILSEQIGYVYVRGEVSNLKISDAGHSYFTLKDEKSQISCVLFRGQNIRINFRDGSRIIVGGSITIYPPRGLYQIVVNEIVIDGLGDLYLRFEALKKKLYEEGLFSEEIKKEIPEFPFSIGVVTSPYGAAIRDFLRTVYNKNPFLKVTIYPARVQGEGSALDIISGIKHFNMKNEVDLIVLIRGGGSFEDLFCFNDEGLAYAIRDSKIPVVTGIGHEIDFTIADYVADYRAATPTAAAEYVVKGADDIGKIILEFRDRLDRAVNERMLDSERVIRRFFGRFYKDKDRFDEKMEYVESCHKRLDKALRDLLTVYYNRVINCTASLERYSPIDKIRRKFDSIRLIDLRMRGAILNYFDKTENRINSSITKLDLLNPENILRKGYSVVYKDNRLISDADSLMQEDIIRIRFYKGNVKAQVKEKGE